MADTPLELYEEAYRLHYHEKKIPDAVKIYEAIIRDFPDSNECGYAFIQLQKVKANDIAKGLKKGPAALYPMVIVTFAASFIALTIAIIGILFLFQQLRLEHHRSTLAIMAISKMSAGSNEYALKLLDEMKESSPSDILVSELWSDITSHKPSAIRSPLPVYAVAAEKPAPEESATVAVAKPAPAKQPAARPKATMPNRRPKQTKNPIIYSADSISYF